jgi:hypothetical protein
MSISCVCVDRARHKHLVVSASNTRPDTQLHATMHHSLILRYRAMNHARFEMTTTATSDHSTCTVACDLISKQLQAGAQCCSI